VKPIARSVIQRFAPGATVGVCVLGCALFLALRPRPSAVAAQTDVDLKSASAAVVAPAIATDSTNENSDAVPAQPTASAKALSVTLPNSSSGPQQDRLAQEVPLLVRATSALSAGRPGDALKALNEHQRRFPHGILSEERRAAKAQALCSLGRLNEGRAELAHLASPSLAAGRAKQTCDSAASAEQP
jgi:hypothetical protein